MNRKVAIARTTISILVAGFFLGASNQPYPNPDKSDDLDSPFGLHGAFSRPYLTDDITPQEVARVFAS